MDRHSEALRRISVVSASRRFNEPLSTQQAEILRKTSECPRRCLPHGVPAVRAYRGKQPIATGWTNGR